MGLLQKALETYESHIVSTQGQHGMTSMAPIAHIVTRADVEITISQDGAFMIADAVEKTASKTIIPATEASAGRTSAPCAHPLCEHLGYLMPQNEEKYQLYVEQLDEWVNSEYAHPKLRPILNYVQGGSIVGDLLRCGLIRLDQNGMPENEKMMIRWRVQGDMPEECWMDKTLFDAYTSYSLNRGEREQGLCMVTGRLMGIASQHPKGVFSLNGNAKLVSTNDHVGFTYRGRFSEDWQAAQVGYETSQKAHNALRWLIQEQGVIYGGRAFLCWNPQGKTVTQPAIPFRQPKTIWSPTDYRDSLREMLKSRKRDFQIADEVIVAAFDAATTGRLAVTYYNEFQAHDFFQRLHDWDETCCWPDRRFGIQTPSLQQIVNCAFGMQTTEKKVTKMTTDDRIMRQEIQRLVACRVERAQIGKDIVQALTMRASQPQSYERAVWETILSTACAVIRKYRYDRFKEEWDMALEPEKKDRSYQFGRLLAVMEKVERDTYDDAEGREPNAIRMQSVFCQRPMYATGVIEKQLEQAYFPRLKPRIRSWYKNIIQQIMEIISENPQETWNLPLEDSYLMGYYLQRSELYKKKDKNVEENEHEYAE